jgi:hypothetical protein
MFKENVSSHLGLGLLEALVISVVIVAKFLPVNNFVGIVGYFVLIWR